MLALVLIWHQPKSEIDLDATYLAIMKSSLLLLLHFWQVIVTKWQEDKLFLAQKHRHLRKSLQRPRQRPRRPKRPRNLQHQKEQVKKVKYFKTFIFFCQPDFEINGSTILCFHFDINKNALNWYQNLSGKFHKEQFLLWTAFTKCIKNKNSQSQLLQEFWADRRNQMALQLFSRIPLPSSPLTKFRLDKLANAKEIAICALYFIFLYLYYPYTLLFY